MTARIALLVLALLPVCSGILPEIMDSGISHILGDDDTQGQTEPEHPLVGVEQPPEEDGDHQDTNNPSTAALPGDLDNNIQYGCVSAEDCGKGKFCLHDAHVSRCQRCKDTDVPCTQDEECCGEQLCVWGQCSQNATKGEAGSTCQHQTDCSLDLCCAFHKALLFPICLAKPIERERCFGAPNNLMELLSWDVQDEGPSKHCPCVGDLHCQHLGRGSMCLKGEDSSEEDQTDTLYSEIDYII